MSEKGELFRSKADEWADANPEGWAYMVEQALISADMGRRFGMKSLVEHVRWHMTTTRTDADFKLNNSYTSALARKLIEEHPRVEPFIETRRSVMDA